MCPWWVSLRWKHTPLQTSQIWVPWLLPTCLEERSSRNPSPPQVTTTSFLRASPDLMSLTCSFPKEPQRLARAGRAHGYRYRLQETKRARSPSSCLVPSHRNTEGGSAVHTTKRQRKATIVQNHHEMPPYGCLVSKNQETTGGKDVEKTESLCTAGGNVK